MNVASLAFFRFGGLFVLEQVRNGCIMIYSKCYKESASDPSPIADPTPHSTWSDRAGADHHGSNWSQRHLYLLDQVRGELPIVRIIKNLARGISITVAMIALMAATALLPITLVLLIVSQGDALLSVIRRVLCCRQASDQGPAEIILSLLALKLSFVLIFLRAPMDNESAQ